jgi:hypothetical protein
MTDVVEVTFPAVGRLAKSLQERQRNQVQLGVVASKDLALYYALLAIIVPKFTEAQASLLVDALNGILYDEYSFTFLAKGVLFSVR